MDSNLIDRFLEGDVSAFNILVEHHKQRIFNLVYRITNDREWAEDITVEVFVEVYVSLRRFRNQAKFSTWLHRIAVNVCLENIRRLKAKKHLREVQLEEGELAAASDPIEGAMARDLAARVTAAIQVLPETHRAAIIMFYLQQRSYAEIAEILGIPRNTAKTRVFHGTKVLRDRLRAEGILPAVSAGQS